MATTAVMTEADMTAEMTEDRVTTVTVVTTEVMTVTAATTEDTTVAMMVTVAMIETGTTTVEVMTAETIGVQMTEEMNEKGNYLMVDSFKVGIGGRVRAKDPDPVIFYTQDPYP